MSSEIVEVRAGDDFIEVFETDGVFDEDDDMIGL